MTRYKVSFVKILLSSDGHSFKCLQQVIQIHRAKSLDRAVQAAERRYARSHRAPDWTLHADILEVEIDGEKIDYRPDPRSGHCNFIHACTVRSRGLTYIK